MNLKYVPNVPNTAYTRQVGLSAFFERIQNLSRIPFSRLDHVPLTCG
jgi:hypothetical protein